MRYGHIIKYYSINVLMVTIIDPVIRQLQPSNVSCYLVDTTGTNVIKYRFIKKQTIYQMFSLMSGRKVVQMYYYY